MASVTVAELRGLARLYRSNVDGAAVRLAEIVSEERDTLPEVLGFPAANLGRLLSAENAVELLVATIEGAPRVARDAKTRAQRAEARALAVILAGETEHRDDGSITLPLERLGEVLACWPGRGLLVLGERGSVDLDRLRALLRECRGVTSTAVVVTESMLVVVYTTALSRGLVRFVLHPITVHVDAVVVPLVELPASAPVIEVPAASEVDEASASDISSLPDDLEPAVPPPPRPRPPVNPGRPWAMRFFDVLADAVGGVP